MKKTVLTLAAVVVFGGAAWAQSAAEKLEKRVQEVSQKATEAFVFFPGGSGALISKDGYCLTNHHVAGAQKSVRVQLHDGRSFTAKNVCTDSVGDVALFKIDAETEFPCLEFGDSDRLEVGQYVLAVGNPFGLSNVTTTKKLYPSVSLGIVSALHRYQQQYTDCIQTDAAVNPGNSGGPLVTLEGKFVGINGRIMTRYYNRVNSGVGFSIPVDQIKNFLPEMMTGGAKGKIYHGQVKGLDLSRAHQNGKGALVSGVRAGTAAEEAGFLKDDMIVKVNGTAIFGRDRFLGVVGIYPMGTEVSVSVRREGRPVELKVKLAKFEGADITGQGPAPPPQGGGYLGIAVDDREEGGVKVTLVRPGSPADDAELVENDIILKLDGKKVADRNDLFGRIQSKKPGTRVKLTILRGDEEKEVQATLGKRPND